jgi:CubicO group peptidase (beta-lactamase class C family)
MQKMTRLTTRVLVAMAGLVIIASATAAPPSAEAIDASIEKAMKEFNVPGMAVSVVRDGKLVYARGQGIVEVGSKKRVGDRTLFQIGSVSKAFTAAALAILVDEGKLDWDSPVIDYLPEFRMTDPWVTREFTIRDLLTHRSGLPLGAGDLLLFPDGNATVADIIHALRFLKPATSFRSRFAYDNLMYIVAGEVVARVAGMPLEDFLEQRVLAPLGMKDCVASLDRAPPGAVLATPHILVDGELVTTTSRVPGAAAAAGGINCSARSMAKWMSFMLNKGVKADGERLISEEQFGQLVGPVTLLPVPPYLSEHAGGNLSAYALGWNISTFYGQPIWSHGGGVWGMTTFIAILPEQGLAVFASGNQMSVAPHAVVYDILDQCLRDSTPAAGQDWIAIIADTMHERRSAADEAVTAERDARDADSTPSLPLAEYAGTYRDDWYGDVHISLTDDGRLWFNSDRNPSLEGPLELFQYDTFIVRWTDRRLHADAYVTFSLNPGGKVERIRMKAVSPATDFSFDFRDLDLRRVE